MHANAGAATFIQGQDIDGKPEGKSDPKDEGLSSDRDNKKKEPTAEQYEAFSPIYKLMYHPALFNPVRAPRFPIVLCHGESQNEISSGILSDYCQVFTDLM